MLSLQFLVVSLMMTSHMKTSYHIILTNYMIANETEKELLKILVGYLKINVDAGFDIKVYETTNALN